jgi:hypothetical protein
MKSYRFKDQNDSSNTIGILIKKPGGNLWHYGHFIHDFIMPVILYINTQNNIVIKNIYLITEDSSHELGTFNRTANKILGVSVKNIKKEECTNIPIVTLYSEYYGPYSNSQFKYIIPHVKSKMKFSESYYKVILIERGVTNLKGNNVDTGSNRRFISNHEEIKNMLTRRYNKLFINVILENLCIEKQVSLFMNAEIVIGQHGAGLSNIIWMNSKNSTIIEIPPYLTDTFKHICIAKDICYVRCNNDIEALQKCLDNIPSRLLLFPDIPRIFWFNIHKDNYNEVKEFYRSININKKYNSIAYKEVDTEEVEIISNLLLKYSILVIVSTINFNDPITNDRLLVTDTFTCLSDLEKSIRLLKFKNSYSIPIELCIKRCSPKRVLLVSPGGCACSAILEFIDKHGITINSNSDKDFMKHLLPEVSILSVYNPTSIIYVYGDIDKLIRSLFRRSINFINTHCHKLSIKDKYVLQADTNNTDLTSMPYTTFKEYIDLVIKTKTEPMGIIQHYNSWKKVPGIFFIHYEDFPKSDNVDEFLGLPKGTCSQFELKERTSVRQPEETDEYLEIINSLQPW